LIAGDDANIQPENIRVGSPTLRSRSSIWIKALVSGGSSGGTV
jgi:hypothetical protein